MLHVDGKRHLKFKKLRKSEHVLFTKTHRSFVQHFNGERFCHIMLTKSLFQLLEWRSLPLPKHYQVNITEHQKRNEKRSNRQKTETLFL